MVMICEGVLNGSQGPLFYPSDEIARSVPHWNARAVVVYHPSMAQSGGSAGHPDVFTSQRVGSVFNARMDRNRLLAEAWIDEQRAFAVDQRVIHAILQGKTMELSTGLFSDYDDVPGTWNGKRYIATARNYRPDHLALLPDQVGACSIADGAGFIRNSINVLNPSFVAA